MNEHTLKREEIFNIVIGSKPKFSFAQIKKVLDAHENTLIKFFNTAIERIEKKVNNLTTENTILRKDMVDLKPLLQFHADVIDDFFLKLTQKFIKHRKD